MPWGIPDSQEQEATRAETREIAPDIDGAVQPTSPRKKIGRPTVAEAKIIDDLVHLFSNRLDDASKELDWSYEYLLAKVTARLKPLQNRTDNDYNDFQSLTAYDRRQPGGENLPADRTGVAARYHEYGDAERPAAKSFAELRDAAKGELTPQQRLKKFRSEFKSLAARVWFLFMCPRIDSDLVK